MSQLLTRPAEWPPSFIEVHLSVFVSNDVRDSLKTLPVSAHVKNSVCHPVSRSYQYYFYAAIFTEIGSKDVPSRTSQVAKPYLQQYRPGTPAVLGGPLNVSLMSAANLKSVTMNDSPRFHICHKLSNSQDNVVFCPPSFSRNPPKFPSLSPRRQALPGLLVLFSQVKRSRPEAKPLCCAH